MFLFSAQCLSVFLPCLSQIKWYAVVAVMHICISDYFPNTPERKRKITPASNMTNSCIIDWFQLQNDRIIQEKKAYTDFVVHLNKSQVSRNCNKYATGTLFPCVRRHRSGALRPAHYQSHNRYSVYPSVNCRPRLLFRSERLPKGPLSPLGVSNM